MARGDVLLVDLPGGDGRVQRGRRPAVALHGDVAGDPLLAVAPATSSLAALRFPFTVRLEPSPDNGLTLPTVVMIFQLRAIDTDFIVRCIGQLSAKDMARVDAEIWRMLKPDTPSSDSTEAR